MSNTKESNQVARSPRSDIVRRSAEDRMKERYRRARKAGVKRNRLGFGGLELDPSKMYKIVNDSDDGNFLYQYSLGWEPVWKGKDDVDLHDDETDLSAAKEGIYSTVVDSKKDGSPLYGYLMWISLDLWDEMQRDKDKRLKKKEGITVESEDKVLDKRTADVGVYVTDAETSTGLHKRVTKG